MAAADLVSGLHVSIWLAGIASWAGSCSCD